jgi:hypothetical protein
MLPISCSNLESGSCTLWGQEAQGTLFLALSRIPAIMLYNDEAQGATVRDHLIVLSAAVPLCMSVPSTSTAKQVGDADGIPSTNWHLCSMEHTVL